MTQPAYGNEYEAAIHNRFAQAEWLRAKLADQRDRSSLDRHPFPKRWFAGELMIADLHAFAAEHHHAVVALAAAARAASMLTDGLLAEQLTRYANDQEDYIDQWAEFAAATGWTRSSWWYFAEDALPQTVGCARAWSGDDRPLADRLITMHAIESAFGAVAQRQLPLTSPLSLVSRAELVYGSYWDLLSGVQVLTERPS